MGRSAGSLAKALGKSIYFLYSNLNELLKYWNAEKRKMSKIGLCLVITGPSAVGKTSVIKRLLEKIPDAVRLVTTTTREPRDGEVNGQDYFFVRREEFLASVARGDFLEYETNYGNFYGSSAVELNRLLQKHQVVFVGGIDTRGARSIKKALPEAITIFLLPGSVDELRQRLISRKGQEQDLCTRLALAQLKIEQSGEFDYRVTNANNHMEEAVEKIETIIQNLSTTNT